MDNTLVSRKPLVGSKFLLMIIFISGGLIGLLVGYAIGANTASLNEVHITEEPLNLHPTDKPTVAPTVVNLSVKYADWQEYILSDCETKFYASHDWVSERIGSYGACGVLYSPETVDNYTFDDIDGLKIVFAEVGGGFDYDYSLIDSDTEFSIDAYILETKEASIYDDVEDDIFISSGQYSVELYESRHVKVNRINDIGVTNSLFYKIGDKWYVIMWNDTSEMYENDILLMLESIRAI